MLYNNFCTGLHFVRRVEFDNLSTRAVLLGVTELILNATAFSRAKAAVSSFAANVASAFAVPAFAAARV